MHIQLCLVTMASKPSGEDTSTWTIIYPTYLDKKASASGGCRVNKAFAVENPHVEEIRAACEKLKVPYVLERVSIRVSIFNML